MREQIYQTVASIEPADDVEKLQIKQTLEWIRSGEEIFRIEKPDNPPKHLVAYCLLYDPHAHKVLLTDHRSSDLWLPTGGHLDRGEHPCSAAKRELKEELFLEAPLYRNEPLFLSATKARYSRHIDITLWYVFTGNSKVEYEFDTREFHSVKWFSFDEIPFENADPNIRRFLNKFE